MCKLWTIIRYPNTYKYPSFLLKYETRAQKDAYKLLSAHSIEEYRKERKNRLLVVVPFKDKWDLTETCLESLLSQDLTGIEMMVALVDNGSIHQDTHKGIAKFKKEEREHLLIRHLRYDIPFNFSKLNNMAFQHCKDFGADSVLFLNNDIELIQKDSIKKIYTFLHETKDCGGVGCSLLYPDGKIQHLFVSVGFKIVGAHPFKGMKFNSHDLWFQSPRPVGAATGAFLMVKLEDFQKVGGFDEDLANCYQDVDLALKLQREGKTNWVLPSITAVHYETQTRNPVHSWDEVDIMYKRWGMFLVDNPYISRSLSRWSEQPLLSMKEGDYPWYWLVS